MGDASGNGRFCDFRYDVGGNLFRGMRHFYYGMRCEGWGEGVRRWVEEAKQGDQAAWAQLVRHFSAMGYAVAIAKLNDPFRAEDAVQDAFAEAFAKLDGLREPAAFPGWFRTIVERQCYRELRRRRPATVPMDERAASAGAPERDDVETIVERRERSELLRRSVEALPERLRLPVQLYYLLGYSIKDIASALNVSPSILKKRLYDARGKLRTALHVADVAAVFHDLHEGGASMLHIVNGDHVGETLKRADIPGDVLVWREVYPAGPIFPNLDDPVCRAARAADLERTMGIPADEYVRHCERQERELARFGEYDEVVLWFEHDLFDQTMLWYLLRWFSGQALGRTKLSLLCIGEFPGIERFRGLGQLTVAQLESLSGTWRPVGREELETGSRLWEAYASPNVEMHEAALGWDTSALPFARSAFRWHLARLPSVRNGLGVVEQTTLEALRDGTRGAIELFRDASDKLGDLGMGDTEYWHRLRRMAERPRALVRFVDGEGRPFDGAGPGSFPVSELRVEPTAFARAAAAGETDAIREIEMDEWYGGLRLEGRVAWRWDAAAGRAAFVD